MCNKASQSNPRFSFPVVLGTAALSRLGRTDEAKASRAVCLSLSHISALPNSSGRIWATGDVGCRRRGSAPNWPAGLKSGDCHAKGQTSTLFP